MSRLWVYGAGGFGRETAAAATAAGLDVAGFLDDGDVGDAVDGHPVARLTGVEVGTAVVAVADPATRRRITETLTGDGWAIGSVVDPAAIFRGSCEVGEGSVVLATAFVSTSVHLGDGAQVNYGATIGHDTVVGRFVTVLPGANVAGSVSLGDEVTIGSGAVLLQGLTIGSGAVVGAGAVVTRDVPAGVTVVGVPARISSPISPGSAADPTGPNG